MINAKLAKEFMDRMEEQVTWSDKGECIEVEINSDDFTYSFSFNPEDEDIEEHRIISKVHESLVIALEEVRENE